MSFLSNSHIAMKPHKNSLSITRVISKEVSPCFLLEWQLPYSFQMFMASVQMCRYQNHQKNTFFLHMPFYTLYRKESNTINFSINCGESASFWKFRITRMITLDDSKKPGVSDDWNERRDIRYHRIYKTTGRFSGSSFTDGKVQMVFSSI